MKHYLNNYEEVNFVLICLMLAVLLLIFGLVYLINRLRSVRSQLNLNHRDMVLVALLLKNELGIGLENLYPSDSLNETDKPPMKRTLFEEINFNKRQIELIEKLLKKQWKIDVSKNISPEMDNIS